MHKTITQKLRNWALRSSLLALPFAYVLFSSNSSGINGRSTSGCSCHGPNNGATMLTITGIPASGWVAGQSYSMTATVTNSAKAGAGFDLSVTAGTLSSAGAGAALVGTTEVRHNTPKSMSGGSASWTFMWTAPSSGTSVNFRFAGNAVNLNGTDDPGDIPNQTTITYNVAVVQPTAVTNAATSITSTTVDLNGSANAEGNSGVTAIFEYGTTSALGLTTTASPSTITGTTATAVMGSLGGLSPNTQYFYRLVLSSSLGTNAGAIMNFTTLPAPPTSPVFGANSATAITTATATVNGSVTPNNTATFGVKYGTTSAMSLTAAASPASGSGTTPVAVSANLNSLLPNTKYYYAFTATVSGTTTASSMDSFTTSPLGVSNVAPERIVVYPNPAQTTLEWSLPAGVKVQDAYAFTLSGQRTALTFTQSGNTTKADVSALAPGVYYLFLDGGSKKYGASFQKN